MCFHKWTKWEQYWAEGVDYGFIWQKNQQGVPFTQRRQRRHCEKCNKEQDELVLPS